MQMTISVSFTVLSVCCMCFLGVMLYQQFTKKAENLTVENSRQLLNQTTINLEDYLRKYAPYFRCNVLYCNKEYGYRERKVWRIL